MSFRVRWSYLFAVVLARAHYPSRGLLTLIPGLFRRWVLIMGRVQRGEMGFHVVYVTAYKARHKL
jgi:hypothetical protein